MDKQIVMYIEVHEVVGTVVDTFLQGKKEYG